MIVGTEACTGACDCVKVGRAVRVVEEGCGEGEGEEERGEVVVGTKTSLPPPGPDFAATTDEGVTVYVWSWEGAIAAAVTFCGCNTARITS